MSVINTNQGAVKLSEIFTDEALALLGSAIGEDALTVIRQLVLADSDAHKKIAALFTSNRNIQWDGSQITFSDGATAANIVIKMLHTEHVTTRTIDLTLAGSLSAPTASTFQTIPLSNNELLYIELDRDLLLASGGTLSIENAVNGGSIVAGRTLKKVALSPTTGLPQLTNAFGGQTRTIFIPLAARIDTVGGGQDLWWIFSGQRWQSGTVQIVGSSSASGEGGTGLVNYITNNTFSAGVTGYNAYDDGSVEVPMDGTGSPHVDLTISSSSVNPLRGSASGVITKASNSQRGKGVSYDFTIDRADEAKPLKIQFDYEVSSGFVPGDASDIRIWVYDIDNNVMIQPTPYTIQGGSGYKHRFIATFQSAIATAGVNARKYRLIFHVAGTTTAAWTFKFDSVFVGPQIVSYGSPVTDWQAYTPVVTNLGGGGAASNIGRWRRVGDTMEVEITFLKDGVSGTGGVPVNFSIPTGYTIDSNKVAFTNVARSAYGAGYRLTGTASDAWIVQYSSTTTVVLSKTGNTYSMVGADIALGNTINMFFRVPITGWGSTVEMSNDTDTRVVHVAVNKNTNQSIPNSSDPGNPFAIAFTTVVNDTHGGWELANNRYKVPVSGIYQVNGSAQFQSNTTGVRILGVNVLDTDGTTSISYSNLDYRYGGSPDGVNMSGAITVKVRVGQYIRLVVSQNSGGALMLNGDANNVHADIFRLSGPSAIAATEQVIARYDLGGKYQSIPTGSYRVIDYSGKVIDTHNAVTVGTGVDGGSMQLLGSANHWIFTAPVAGFYRVTASFRFENSNQWLTGQYQSMALHKAPVTGAFGLYSRLDETFAQTTYAPGGSPINFFVHGSDVIQLLAGERICVTIDHNNANPQTTLGQAPHHHIVIEKINR